MKPADSSKQSEVAGNQSSTSNAAVNVLSSRTVNTLRRANVMFNSRDCLTNGNAAPSLAVWLDVHLLLRSRSALAAPPLPKDSGQPVRSRSSPGKPGARIQKSAGHPQ